MARLQTVPTIIKPLKPFRRGETLGKASRAAKPSGVFRTKVGLNGPPAGAAAPGEGAKKKKNKKNKKGKGKGEKEVDAPVAEEGDVAAGDEAEEEPEEGSGEETGDEGVEPAPVPKKKKVFVEGQDALLSLVASATAESETIKKTKLAKQKPVRKAAAPLASKPKERSKEAGSMKKHRLEVAKKAVVSAKSEAKKAQQQGQKKLAVTVDDDDSSSRKKVSFA